MILKRIFDILVSLLILVFFFPLYLIVAIAIRWKLGRPVLYQQERAGQFGTPFKLYKFRTMTGATDPNGIFLPDHERLTPLGRFLRNTSLDELPEIWNVVRGEMSLVGPRPLLVRYIPRYNSEQLRRLEVKPGVTGWAQIHGRNALSWEDKFKEDVWYVNHRSFWLDIKILAITAVKIIQQEGISAKGHATMPEFYGSQES